MLSEIEDDVIQHLFKLKNRQIIKVFARCALKQKARKSSNKMKSEKARSSSENKIKKSFVIRIDESTYKLLEKWANDEFRSVNGQIEFLLNQNLINSGRKKKE
ncbi:Uncharacterised protein [Chryseobacterium taihuense]|uniref:Arc-like DNA binding domain-containing protein n=1 Tax=Chryseobacterium taihuense TaxID=1141221 RepID=A0A4U8W977_9FLAO|nr:Uncharacterised protein [Chryseobacterium taihuense]